MTKKVNEINVIIKISLKRDVKQVTGTIKFETKKLILLDISGGESWIPKSVIRSLFKSWSEKEQLFYIDSWFLEKNQIPQISGKIHKIFNLLHIRIKRKDKISLFSWNFYTTFWAKIFVFIQFISTKFT